MALTITGTFPEGIITVDGKLCQEFTLAEQTFRTTLEIAHDPAIDKDLLDDEVYYSACLMSKRLTVEGVDKLTPEQILDLGADDSSELVTKTMLLETQRANFRSAAKAAAEKASGTAEAGDSLE